MRGWIALLAAAVVQAQGPWPYATYLGGAGDDTARFVTSDDAGNTYVVGLSATLGPPFTNEPEGYLNAGRIFLTKFDPAGQILYTRVLGVGLPGALALDREGNVLIGGTVVVSSDFATPGAFQPEAVSSQAFLAKYSPTGEKLFATYFGTRNSVQINALTSDAEGRLVFCGQAAEDAVPLTANTLFRPVARRFTAYCAQLSADGSRLLFSTLLGNPSNSVFPQGVELDSEGHLLVSGSTLAADLPLVKAFQSEDRRRSLFLAGADGRYQSRATAALGTALSVQTLGQTVYVGTQDSGAWQSADGGDTWKQLPGSPPGTLVVNPKNPASMCVVTTASQSLCSTNRGEAWQLSSPFGVTGLVPDPRADAQAPFPFVVTTDRMTGSISYFGLGPIAWVDFSATGDRILTVPLTTRALHLSTDRGVTFRRLADGIARAAISPVAASRLYALRSIRTTEQDTLIIRSDDGGATWSNTAANAPFQRVEQLVADPADADTLYVTTGIGAYRSTDAGTTWQPWMPPGLDNVAVKTLSFDAEGRPWVGTVSGGNGFLMKLRIDEPAIVWSTLFGGAGGGAFGRLRLASDGRIVLFGNALGYDLPATGEELGPRQSPAGFLAEFDAGGQLASLRYVGTAINAMDRGADGTLHLAHTTTPAAIGSTNQMYGEFAGGPNDALWLTLSPGAGQFGEATWFGGEAADQAAAIHVGRDGRVRLAGTTQSRKLPVRADAAQSKLARDLSPAFGGTAFLAISPIR